MTFGGMKPLSGEEKCQTMKEGKEEGMSQSASKYHLPQTNLSRYYMKNRIILYLFSLTEKVVLFLLLFKITAF